MDTSNVFFLLLVSFLATSMITVAMLPLNVGSPPARGQEPGRGDNNPPMETPPTRRLQLASLYLRDLEAQNWQKPAVCLAPQQTPAQTDGMNNNDSQRTATTAHPLTVPAR